MNTFYRKSHVSIFVTLRQASLERPLGNPRKSSNDLGLRIEGLGFRVAGLGFRF